MVIKYFSVCACVSCITNKGVAVGEMAIHVVSDYCCVSEHEETGSLDAH